MSRKIPVGRGGKEMLKARDKVLTKMTRDGLVEQNITAGNENRISKRDKRHDLRNNAPDEIVADIQGDTPFGDVPGIVKSEDSPFSDISDSGKPGSLSQVGITPEQGTESSSQFGIRMDRGGNIGVNPDTVAADRKQQSKHNRQKQRLSKGTSDDGTAKHQAISYTTPTPPSITSQGSEDDSEAFILPPKPAGTVLHFPARSPSQTDTGPTDEIGITDGDIPVDEIKPAVKAKSTIEPKLVVEPKRSISDKSRSKRLKTSGDKQHQPNGRITHESKNPANLNEHKLSNIRKTRASQKFTLATSANIGEALGGGTEDIAQARHPKRRKSKWLQEVAPALQASDENENPNRLKFTDDEAEAQADLENYDEGSNSQDVDSYPDGNDQDIYGEYDVNEDIPFQEDAALQETSSTPKPGSASLRSKQLHHKRQKTKLQDGEGSTDRLSDSPTATPLYETPTHPRTQQQQERQSGFDGSGNNFGNGGSGSSGSNNSPIVNAADSVTAKQSARTSRLEHRVAETSEKLDRARNNLPTKGKIYIERSFDEDKGKASNRLRFGAEIKSQREHLKGPMPLRPLKLGVNAAIAKAHMKIYQAENENVGTKAAHRTELAGETVLRSALRHRKLAPYKKVAKLERKLSGQSAKLSYRRAIEANPRLKRNPIARLWYKRRIKRQQAKALRQSRKAAGVFKKGGSLTAKATRLLISVIKRNPKVIIAVVVLFLAVNIIASLIAALSGLGSSGAGVVFATTYLSDEQEIEAVSLAYNRWEMDLLMEIMEAENGYPGFDEYRFNTGEISHNPFELIAYLTATRYVFTLDELEAELRELFEEQYQLSFSPSVEVRYREEENDDGETILVAFDWHIMTVTLTARNFSDVIAERMAPDQRQHFDILMQTRGQRQMVGNPFRFPWRQFISSEYGYRIHPITGERDLHRGIDIGLPTGTEILAGIDGIISFAGTMGGYGNIVIIQGNNGLEVRYAHMDSIGVNVGQEINTGDVIGTVGNTGASTGSHLHLEVLRNGQFLNPVFFTNMGRGDIPDPSLPSINNNPPLPPMGDGSFEAMMELAQTLLGRPYVWGASGPNSFDCSGLVYFLKNQSGAASIGRSTAQGYYNMSSPVSPSEAVPGDLVFFHSTFSSPRFITHIGIYLGDNLFLHTGSNPNGVEIVRLDTPFWQRHFHAFGRIN